MLCIRANSSLSRFARRWRGGCFLFWSNGFALRAGQRQAGFFFKLVLAPVRGDSFLFWSNGFALRAGQRQGGVFRIPPPYLWTPLSPQRVKGYSPLTIPKKKSKRKKASRCAKTGCGAQRPLRALSGTRVLLTAAPTAPPCFRRRRRSSPLQERGCSPLSDPKEEVEAQKC